MAEILAALKIADPIIRAIIPAIRNNPKLAKQAARRAYTMIPALTKIYLPFNINDIYFLIDVISTAKFTEEDYNKSKEHLSKIDPKFFNSVVSQLGKLPNQEDKDFAKKFNSFYNPRIHRGGNRNTFKVSNPMYILATNRKHMYLI